MNKVRFLSKITLVAGFALAMAFTFSCSSSIEDDYYGWYGSGKNYTISTVKQLEGLADIVRGSCNREGCYENMPSQDDFKGKTITLTSDINLNNQRWRAIGYSYLPLYPFNGTFDGDNKTISGLNADNQGFFGLIGEYGIVKNITFVNFNASGSDGIGGLTRTNKGIIENITITNGTVSGGSTGGVVSFNSGTIQNVNFSGTVTVNSGDAGGIASSNSSSGIIRNCTVTGTVNNYRNSSYDGIVGSNNGIVENCVYNNQ